MEVWPCVGVGCLAACSAGLALGAAGEKGARPVPASREELLREELLREGLARLSALPALGRLARGPRVRRVVARLRPGLPAAVRSLSDAELLACGLVALCASALAGFVLAGSPLGAAAGAAGVCALVARRAGKARAGERAALEQAMPEVFQTLAVALGSGRSVPQAFRYVGEGEREPIAGAFSRAAFSLDCGVPLSEVLAVLEREIDAPGLDLVVPAIGVSQRTGAPLKELLEEASGIVSERLALERALEVKTSQARMSAQVVAAMPLVMIGFLGLFSADFRAGAATPVGVGAIAAALALDAVAWWIIRRIMDVGV